MSLDHLDDVEPFHPTTALRAGVAARARSLRRRRRSALGASSVVLALLLVIGAGSAYGWRQQARVQRIDTAASLTPGAGPGAAFTLLAVGVDGATDPEEAVDLDGSPAVGRGGRSDTMLLVRVDPKAGRLALISIPRDLWVARDGGGHTRINGLLPEGGPGLLIDTVESTFGVAVNHYLELDFDGLRAIADAAGGLTVEFPAPTRDRQSGLDQEQGCQRLDGTEVLALVRSRQVETRTADGGWVRDQQSDLSRMARQRTVLIAALRSLQGTGLDPLRLDRLIGAVTDHTKIDESFTLAQLTGIAVWLHGLPADAITQAMVPVEPFTTDGGASVLRPQPGFDAYVRAHLDGADPAAPDAGPRDLTVIDPFIAPC